MAIPLTEVADRMRSAIDADKLAMLRCSLQPSWQKFADLRFQIGETLAHVERLKLNQTPPLRLLDLGCGFGWLCLAGHVLGHDVAGVNEFRPEVQSAWRIMPQRPLDFHTIAPNVKISPYRAGFDLITLNGVNFHQPRWNPTSLRALMSDLFDRLSENGRIECFWNIGKATEWLYLPKTWRAIGDVEFHGENVVRVWPRPGSAGVAENRSTSAV